MKKEISIIIPCYNVEKEIDRCLQSLFEQTIGIDSLEIILVDDCSEDGTMTKLKIFEEKFPDSVIVICCDKNAKLGTARNIGMSYSTAPYLFFLDADDWLDSAMLEALLNEIRESALDIVIGGMGRDFGDGKLINKDLFKCPAEDHEVVRIKMSEKEKLLLNDLSVRCCGILFDRSFLLGNAISFPEYTFFEDFYFMSLVWYYLTSYTYLSKYAYHYFVNPKSITGKGYNFDEICTYMRIVLVTIEELEKRGFVLKYSRAIELLFFQNYFVNTMHRILIAECLSIVELRKIYSELLKEICHRYPNGAGEYVIEKLSDIGRFFVKECVGLKSEDLGRLRKEYRRLWEVPS